MLPNLNPFTNDNRRVSPNANRCISQHARRQSWQVNSRKTQNVRNRFSVEALEPRQLLAANPVLTEFMADNDENLGLEELVYKVEPGRDDAGVFNYPFREGKSPDWVEVYNDGDEAIDLKGHFLTDDLDNPKQWEFPSVVLEAGKHLLVFADGDANSMDADGFLHANFGLSSDGDNLALVSPEGEIISQFGSEQNEFPEQLSQVSFGFPQTATLITSTSKSMYWVPDGPTHDRDWMKPEFDAAANGFTEGTNALGYEGRPDDRTNFNGLFTTELPSGIQAAYVRYEFDVQNAADVTTLLMRLQVDNGFVAYLNGEQIVSDNAPNALGWFSSAPASGGRDSTVVRNGLVDFDLAEHSDKLVEGKNVLAIHLLNHLGTTSETSDMLLVTELYADASLEGANVGYLATPTPGAANIVFDASTGPVINNVTENPGTLTDDQDLLITAEISELNAPVSSVSLLYQVMFNDTVTVAMTDDGTGGDQQANDGIYSATIPHDASGPGEMVRWKVTATDTDGGLMQWPLHAVTHDSDEFFGTIVEDPDVATSNLPILYWFIDDANFGRSASDTGGRGSMFYLGEFYDNVQTDAHGQSSRGFPKKSYDIDFNRGNRFKWSEGEDRVVDINLLNNWADKGKFRNTLGYEIPREAGDPALFAFPIRVEKNGEFFSTADFVEDADRRTLDRWGLNPDGALYKMYNTFTTAGHARVFADTTTGAEKKSRKWDDSAELVELQDATRLRGDEWTNYAMDNINVAAFVNFQAVQDITSNHDCCHKNYYFYRDTGQTNEWRPIIWDVDLTFGHHWRSNVNYFEDRMSFDNGLERGSNNGLIQAVFRLDGVNEMYERRLRTLMDQFIQPLDTPYEDRYFERRLDEMVALIDPHDDPIEERENPARGEPHAISLGVDDADLDFNAWGSWENGNGGRIHAARGETMREHIERVKSDYADPRREFLYSQRGIPDAQGGNPAIAFGEIEFDPASGNQSEEYLTLVNENADYVDISGWSLAGSINYTFQAGTVIPPDWTLYVTPDVNAFRARTEGPSGGQGLFIQGGYQGDLDNGSSITLVGADGIPIQRTFVGELQSPSDVQASLRITEVNFNPHAPNSVPGLNELDDGTENAADQFEFIELTNVGSNLLDVSGARLSIGVDFTFPDGTTIDPNEYVLVVRDREAFESRYGNGFEIVGEFQGSLNDTGDGVFIDDAAGQPGTGLVFGVGGAWPERANGGASSLEIVNPRGDASSSANWKASDSFGGSPGQASEILKSSVVINEVLANSDSADRDQVELLNTSGSDVDISNWYLSNSAENYAKHQIPAGTVIPAGSYLVLDQSDLGFGLHGARGDQLTLLAADENGIPTHFADDVRIAASTQGVSFGPGPGGSFVPLKSTTFGGANADRRPGDVVITEILHDALDPDGVGGQRDRNFKFIELYNTTDQPIDLNGWALKGSTTLEFEEETIIGAGKTLLMVPFRSTSNTTKTVFNFTYSVPNDTPFAYRWGGNPEDGDTLLQLTRPGQESTDEPGFVPTLVSDEVDYELESPWPVTEKGQSLQRVSADALSQLTTSWVVDAPSAGKFEEREVVLPGDSNGDGMFNQLDIVAVLQAGKYQTGQAASFAEGDWNGDGVFDSLDIVAALQTGQYSAGLAASNSLAKDVDSTNDETAADLALREFEFRRV